MDRLRNALTLTFGHTQTTGRRADFGDLQHSSSLQKLQQAQGSLVKLTAILGMDEALETLINAGQGLDDKVCSSRIAKLQPPNNKGLFEHFELFLVILGVWTDCYTD